MLAGEGYLLETDYADWQRITVFAIHTALSHTMHTTNYLSQVQMHHCPGVVSGRPSALASMQRRQLQYALLIIRTSGSPNTNSVPSFS
eukprot:5972117-Prymnesium_polylepis.1